MTIHAGWQCIHLESTNNREAAIQLRHCPEKVSYSNFSVYIVWSFPLVLQWSASSFTFGPIGRKSQCKITNEKREM